MALTRRKGESIVIDGQVEVVVLGVQGEQVKLGIVAPKSVAVHRKEVYDQIQAENLAAAKHAGVDLHKLNTMMQKKD